MAKGGNYNILFTVGATLSNGFNAVFSDSTSKIKKIGGVIKDLEKQSTISGRAILNLKSRYNSLLGSLNKQQAIVKQRGVYRSQIMDMVALGASLAAPIKSAMDFENSLSKIAAVVNFPEPDGLKKLGSQLTEISLKVPKTADELASIAAIGGSFQVPLKDLTTFTEEVAKTSVAWRANSDETAQRVGNLMKVFNVETAQLSEYFDAFNDLGNKAGASANSILKGVTKASGGLANFKIALPQAAALTSTIISFGENAETAGAQVSTMLLRLSIAPKLGADAQKALHSIGLSSVTLSKMIQSNPEKALDKIFTALKKLDPENRATVMYSIFGRGASATVGKLVNNLDLYRKNLQIVANAKNLKGSRDGDYSIVFDTTQSQLVLLRNSFSTFTREIGFSLLPTLKNVLSSINAILKPVMTWIQNNRELTTTITTTLAGLISFRVATFTLGYASTFLFGGLNKLVIVFKGLRLGLSLLGVAFRASLGWIGAFLTAGWLIYENWKSIQEFLEKIWEPVKPYWGSFKATMDELGITDFIINAWVPIKKFFSNIWDKAVQSWNLFIAKLQEFGVIDTIKQKWESLKTFFKGIADYLSPIIDKIKSPFVNLWEGAKSISSKINNFFDSEKSTNTSQLKIPELKNLKSDITKNQSNNFTINIQATRNDNPESIANRIVNRISDYSKTFLYDEAEVA